MEKILKLNSNDEAIAIYGNLDENLRYAEQKFDVRISARNYRLKIIGEKEGVQQAAQFFHDKLREYRDSRSARRVVSDTRIPSNERNEVKGMGQTGGAGDIQFYHRGKIIQPRGKNQARYLEAIRDNDIVFGIGPAGTGKTYLAMAAAVDFLKKKLIKRIILTRPAVEAGENLGFLPGDLYEKVNPYLRPLYDALHDMIDFEEVARYLERGIIEVAPLAYMRGRTLDDAFVIIDEAQNTTTAQMKMFLTRLGEHSRTVVTGDITQIDLPGGRSSGLVEAKHVLSSVKGIKFLYFEAGDVVRHPLVEQIVKAYEKHQKKAAR